MKNKPNIFDLFDADYRLNTAIGRKLARLITIEEIKKQTAELNNN